MPTNHTARVDRPRKVGSDATVSVSHLLNTLRAYRAIILLSMVGLAVSTTAIVIIILLASPSLTTTRLEFRLDFEGAGKREYPNGLRFSPDEIVGADVLLAVHAANKLERFIDFAPFSHALTVLESNSDYEKLANEYQSRLADPRLTSVDRDRIDKEFALRRESLAKNAYAIAYLRNEEGARLPEDLVAKVLVDVLDQWASFAVKEQRVLDYRAAVLSPQVLDETSRGPGDFIADIQRLREKSSRVVENVLELERAPGAQLARTSTGTSLREIRMRLDEITRFRLEPLVVIVRSSGLIADSTATVRFLQSQLAFDVRRQEAAQAEADAIKRAIAAYLGEWQQGMASISAAEVKARPPGAAAGETVMPQFSDSFLDRLVALTSRSNDEQFRRQLVTDYRSAMSRSIAIGQEVAYDRQVLADVKEAAVGANRVSPTVVEAQLASARDEVRQLIVRMNELHGIISRNAAPSQQLYTRTGSPVTRTEHSRSISRLFLYEGVVLLLAFPIIVLLCFIHNRAREEEAELVNSLSDGS